MQGRKLSEAQKSIKEQENRFDNNEECVLRGCMHLQEVTLCIS